METSTSRLPLVNDKEAAEMQAHIMAGSDDAVADYKDMAERLLADRERLLALAHEQDAALRLTTAEIHRCAGLLSEGYNYNPTAEATNASQYASGHYDAILKEAHGD